MNNMNLFGESKTEKIRTLGFYQPFGSLMLHGKIETRWVRKGKKPPFPLGKYLFYTTLNSCDRNTLVNWCGNEIIAHISEVLEYDTTRYFTGMAIGMGELVKVRPLEKEDEPLAFVKFLGEKTEIINGVETTKVQQALIFENVTAIKPFIWNHGKQGIGFVPDFELDKIIEVIEVVKESN